MKKKNESESSPNNNKKKKNIECSLVWASPQTKKRIYGKGELGDTQTSVALAALKH